MLYVSDTMWGKYAITIFATALLLMGCDMRKPAWRTYEEINVGPSPSRTMAPMPMDQSAPAAGAGTFHWTSPEGWTEQPGSGMRLVTFTVTRDGRSATCTIVTLGGAAGGLEPNVRRWMGQLNIEAPPADELSAFLERQERIQSEGGLEGVAVDLTELGNQSPETPSMLATLFSVNDATLFVKLTGPLGMLKEERDSFLKLCRSLGSDGQGAGHD